MLRSAETVDWLLYGLWDPHGACMGCASQATLFTHTSIHHLPANCHPTQRCTEGMTSCWRYTMCLSDTTLSFWTLC